ncbi:MAG: cupin domain-containing protein [Beijerinckiaceae bacterium]|nr:cupin domain-containing protein [Beijerinckiaceae bacterium]
MTNQSPASIRIRPEDCPPPPADKPTSATKAYADPTGALTSGIWRSQANRLEVNYARDEFCLIVEGEVHLTDADGHTEIYRPGDGFMVPAGFRGIWDMPVPVTKFYVLHAAAKATP